MSLNNIRSHQVKNSIQFMKHQNSLPVSQDPSIGSSRSPRESSPHTLLFPLSTPVHFPRGEVLTSYLTNILNKTYFSSPICKLYSVHLMCLSFCHRNKVS
jgi:hypothetical protein